MGQTCSACFNGHKWGEGSKIGGKEIDHGTAEERRAARAAAAQERMNKTAIKGPKPNTLEKKRTTKSNNAQQNENLGDRIGNELEAQTDTVTDGNESINVDKTPGTTTPSLGPDASRSDRASAAAAAAKSRMEAEYAKSNLNGDKAKDLKLRQQKDALIGKINYYYKEAGRDPPFGLAAASPDKLQKQLEYAKGLTKKTAVANAAAKAIK